MTTITRKRPLAQATMSRWSFPLILVFQALLSWVLLQNMAFQDEALYIYAGRQILQHWLFGARLYGSYSYSYYFSGYPYVFPVIGGALDMLGGLELVRFFCLLCMLATTACGYYVTKQLFNQRTAIFAIIFFVCQGPVLFLGRLATYDPLCLCMLAIATALAVKAGQSRRPWGALSVGPFLVLAFFAKYAAILFIPSILVMMALCALLGGGWKRMLIRSVLGLFSFTALAMLAALLVIRFDPDMLHAFEGSTINRVIHVIYSRIWLAEHVVTMAGLSFIVSLIGLLFARKKHLLIAFLLFGSALLIPAYHIYKAEWVSLDKHLAFSMFYVMPVAGHALTSLSGFRPNLRRVFSAERYWLSSVGICLMLFLVGASEAQNMYSAWGSTTQLTGVFNTQVRSANGRYLVDQMEVLRYNLRDDTYTWQWIGLDFFQYTDKQGHYYVGPPAYDAAINDGYFALIELNYTYNVPLAILIDQAIIHSKNYERIAVIHYNNVYGGGCFWVWRKLSLSDDASLGHKPDTVSSVADYDHSCNY